MGLDQLASRVMLRHPTMQPSGQRGRLMVYKTASSQSGFVRVCFELPPVVWADHIAVVGDFNGWCTDATPMRQGRDGVWRATIDLPYGSHCQFRYLVDGRWMTDYHADCAVVNDYGSENSLIIARLPDEALMPKRQPSQVYNGLDHAPNHFVRHTRRVD
jgi:hypothetical protein